MLSPPDVGAGDPVLANLFRVAVYPSGLDTPFTVGFARIEEIVSEITVEVIAECTHPVDIKLPGQSGPAAVRFTRGVTNKGNLARLVKWHADVRARKSEALYGQVLVYLMGRSRTTKSGTDSMLTMELRDAWPSALHVGAFDALSSDVALQSVVFQTNQVLIDRL